MTMAASNLSEDDYPDFTGHVSLLSKHLTYEVYKILQGVVTASGFTLNKAIEYGVNDPGKTRSVFHSYSTRSDLKRGDDREESLIT